MARKSGPLGLTPASLEVTYLERAGDLQFVEGIGRRLANLFNKGTHADIRTVFLG